MGDFDAADPLECLLVARLSSSQFLPKDPRTRVDDLVDGKEVGAMVELSIGDPLGEVDVVDPTYGVILNSLELVETGDRAGV